MWREEPGSAVAGVDPFARNRCFPTGSSCSCFVKYVTKSVPTPSGYGVGPGNSRLDRQGRTAGFCPPAAAGSPAGRTNGRRTKGLRPIRHQPRLGRKGEQSQPARTGGGSEKDGRWPALLPICAAEARLRDAGGQRLTQPCARTNRPGPRAIVVGRRLPGFACAG